MITSYLLGRCVLARRQRVSMSSAACSRNFGAASSKRSPSSPMHLSTPSTSSFHVSYMYSSYTHHMNLRCLSTNNGTDENDDLEWKAPENYAETHRHTPQNDHQRKLVDYTNALLSTDDKEYPIGAYPITDLIQMSNCIDSWIASGEHRYLGAQQAELLVKRLIIERGGGKSLMGENDEEFVGGNIDVTWDMYHLESVRT